MLKFLSEGQLLTEALKAAEEGAASLSDLEELCAPFHPSRRIRPKYLSTSASSPTAVSCGEAPARHRPARYGPRLADVAWLVAEAGFWLEANWAAATCREIHSDNRILVAGTARLVANKALGRTKLHHACLVGDTSRALALLDCGGMSRVRGADPNAITVCGTTPKGLCTTPLGLALLGVHATIARALVERGARIDADRYGNTFFRAPKGDAEARVREFELQRSRKSLLLELMRMPQVSAGEALILAIDLKLADVVREKLSEGAAELGWTAEVGGDLAGRSFEVVFGPGRLDFALGTKLGPGQYSYKSDEEKAEIASSAAASSGRVVMTLVKGGQAQALGLRKFDEITHIAGANVCGQSVEAVARHLQLARAISDRVALMIARPTEASIARMMAASEVGAGFFDMIFEMQDDLANAEVVRLLGEHLKFYDLDGLYLNRTLGCPSWVRDLHAELVTENGDLLLDFDDYRLENLFHAAAQANAVDIVQQCIHAGVDINCSDEEPAMGGMAVFHASERNCVAVVSLLCNCADIDADAALIAAAECGLEAEVKSLLERGANINIFDRRVRGVWPLSGAVTQGHAAIVRLLVARPECLLEDPLHRDREKGQWFEDSPLVSACENGRPDVVSLLLAHRHGGRLSVDCGALSMAIVSNNADCAQLLLDAGACINSPAPRQYIYARTVVRTNVFDQEEPGDMAILPASIGPLALACVLGRTEIAAELLRRGANCNAVDFAGRTALMGACYEGRDDILRLLLGAAGVGAGARAPALAVNLCDTEGRTALAWACARHNEGCVRQLLACQEIEAGLVDVLGRSAADLAQGHPAILSHLRERGVVPTSTVK